ncbi:MULTISPECIES: hypothetical protein [Pseudomonas]|jgi:hypothetical protein|uniref:Uncharacterized protein n=1 Tax=Pseudomonas chlororaphis subsp. aurantiaca TaxID=86192 RepID=A0AAJ0ZKH6_9PSED|nr:MULTISPECIES: hypothetical protein [Pseudomonas]AZD24298.1 hypothetical protein C4K24_5019 [Pseudomonas chlororaphis subsp. aurantiaca]AZD31624.1 hypothetical protein C4K23_4898 [Pseudomonas chlororaphis]AZD81659.1 hypothetical protein C4K15_5116 [Pseudomonas chlororaphis subsp. aurantiaca]MBU4634321.1 hypothetical protein [Pseudomonas chlororaphis subsp. aurantiaca]
MPSVDFPLAQGAFFELAGRRFWGFLLGMNLDMIATRCNNRHALLREPIKIISG